MSSSKKAAGAFVAVAAAPSASTASPRPPPPSPPPPYVTTPSGLRVSRVELLLLLSSTLRSLGCEAAVAALSAESGGSLSGAHGRVEALLQLVRAGEWKQARGQLRSLRVPSLGRQQRLRLRLLLLSAAFLEQVEAALEQKRLPIEALLTLQQRVGPAQRTLERLQTSAAGNTPRASPSHASSSPTSLFTWTALCAAALSSPVALSRGGGCSVMERLSCYLLMSDVSELNRVSGWDGRRGRSRYELADLIAEWMPSDAAVAPKRLLSLIDSALQHDLTHSELTSTPTHHSSGHSAHTTAIAPPQAERGAAEGEGTAGFTSLLHRHHARSMSASLTHAHRSRSPPSAALAVAPPQSVCVLQGHSDEVLHLRWSHNHRMLASVSKDQTCVLWKDDSSSTSTPSSSSSPSPSFQRHLVLRGHPVPLWFVCWSLDDSLVLACGSSSEVSLWSASSGELRLRCDSTHREPVQSCAFVCDDAAFVTASADRSIIMRDVERGAVLHRWTVDLLTDLHVTADQRFILSAGHSGLMEAIDVRTKRKAAMQLFPTSASTSAASASNHGNGSGGPAAALAAAQAALASHGYHPLHTPPLQQSAVAAFELSDDGMRVLVTATKPPELLSFDLRPLLSLLSSTSSSAPFSSSMSAPSTHPTSSPLTFPSSPSFPPPPPPSSSASSSSSSSPSSLPPPLSVLPPLPLLGRASGFVQSRYVLRPAFVDSAYSLAAVGSEDCQLRVYHLQSGSLVMQYEGHTGTVNAVAADLSRQLMATASDDHTIRIYHTPTLTNTPHTQHTHGGLAAARHADTAAEQPHEKDEDEQEEELSDEDEEEPR